MMRIHHRGGWLMTAAWQIGHGMQQKFRHRQTTQIGVVRRQTPNTAAAVTTDDTLDVHGTLFEQRTNGGDIVRGKAHSTSCVARGRRDTSTNGTG